jgi:iron complex transport system substrate-binding protein
MLNTLLRMRIRFILHGLLIILAVLAVATDVPGAIAAGRPPSAPTVYDSSRIVSIGGSITEILYALGLQQKIVAVDTTSLYPPSALKDKPNVGYMRQLSAEGALALSPTLIFAIEGSGPQATLDVLKQANVPFISVPDRFSGDGIIDKIDLIARDVGEPRRGACLTAAVRRDLAALDTLRDQIHQRLKVVFLLSLANGRPLVAGRATAADGIIAMAGARNAFDDFDGYKMVSDESIVAAKPDAILAMQSGEHALSAETVFSQPALAMTPAARNKNLIAMDGLYLLGFGPRTAQAARDLALRLYPQLKIGNWSSGNNRTACDQ